MSQPKEPSLCQTHNASFDSFCCTCLLPLCLDCLASHLPSHRTITLPLLKNLLASVVSQLSQRHIFEQPESPSPPKFDLSTNSGVIQAATEYGRFCPASRLVALHDSNLAAIVSRPKYPIYIIACGIVRMNPESGKFVICSMCPPNQYDCGMCMVGPVLYVCGGRNAGSDSGRICSDMYSMDLSKCSKSPGMKPTPIRLADLKVAKTATCLVELLGREILSVAGFCGSPMNDCEIYDIRENKWRFTYPLNDSRTEPTLVCFNSHIVYCIGGAFSKISAESIDMFDDSPWKTLNVAGLRTMTTLNGVVIGAQVSNTEILHLDLSDAYLLDLYKTTAAEVGKFSNRNSNSQSICAWRKGRVYFVADDVATNWNTYDTRSHELRTHHSVSS